MERSVCSLFGVVTYGVHMSIYEEVEVEGQRRMQVRVPTSSRTKQTYVHRLLALISMESDSSHFTCRWPDFLDNTVAEGIPSGMPIFESLVKGFMEEVSGGDQLLQVCDLHR
jgi:hypothetical protein